VEKTCHPRPVEVTGSMLAKIMGGLKGLLLVICDEQWNIQFVNPGFADLTGLSQDQLTGRVFPDLLTPNARRHLLESTGAPGLSDAPLMLHLATKEKEVRSLSMYHELDAGRRTLAGEPLFEEQALFSREMVEMNNQLADLTRENARKKRQLALALRDLQEAQSMLVHREKMATLGQMTAGIAHEINNPLSFVLNNQVTLGRDFTDLLSLLEVYGKTKPALAETQPQLGQELERTEEAIDLPYLAESIPKKLEANLEGLRRVRQLVLDLRTFSRLDEDGMKPADLAEGIRKAVQFLEPMLQEHRITVETAFSQVPDAVCAHGAINQVVTNLLSNAIAASRPGQTVRVTLEADELEHRISIRDEGEGIPEEHLSRIFLPFFTTRPVGSGTGLGLSIARQIVERHGGTIEVDSSVGVGTRMTVRLPRDRPENTRKKENES